MKKLAFILAVYGFIQPIILNGFGILQRLKNPIDLQIAKNEPFTFVHRSLLFSVLTTIPYVIILFIVYFNVREGEKGNIGYPHKFATILTMVAILCYTSILSFMDYFRQFHGFSSFHFPILFGVIPISSIGLVFMIYFIGIAIERLQKRRVGEVK